MTLTRRARPPMRVGINLLWLVPGVVGGSEEYATRLLRAVADVAPDDLELVLFALRPFSSAHPDLASRFRVVTLPIDGANKPLRVQAESTWLPWQVQHDRVQAVHHVGGRVPLVSRAPAILTIHDLQPLDMPENFSRTKRAFLGRALPRSASRAAMITTPSEFVRRGVVSRFGIDEDRVVAVPAPVRLDEDGDGAHARSYATGADNVSPYFVYPAITYAHKNHGMLLEAFAQLVRDRPDVRLVLTGGEGPSEPAVRADIARLGIQGKVVRTGRIPRDELDALVDGARAVVFPSRYEGFGLPVLEAMASGCPVIAADATALPEVVGDAGQLVGPDDVEGWRAAMARALDDDGERSGEPGRRQAAGYSEAASVALLLGVYRQALRERARVV